MATTDRYSRPADLPPRIPLFPLRGAILLPRATLPLNVFEPRYLALVDEALSGHRLVGIVQPASGGTSSTGGGSETMESPPGKDVDLRRIGCVGRITSFQEQDDGRVLITLTGVARFEILDEAATGTPFRVASVSYDRFAADLTHGLGEQDVDRENLLRVLKTYLEANRLRADWSAIQRSPSELLVNALSVMAPYGAEEKQALLEAVDLKTRADVLVALAEMDLASSGSAGGTVQ